MFASKNRNAAVLDFGFLGKPLSARLMHSVAKPARNPRPLRCRDGVLDRLGDAIDSMLSSFGIRMAWA